MAKRNGSGVKVVAQVALIGRSKRPARDRGADVAGGPRDRDDGVLRYRAPRAQCREERAAEWVQAAQAAHAGGHADPVGATGSREYVLHADLSRATSAMNRLALALMAMYLEGGSTRKAANTTEVLCSKSLVSHLAGGLATELAAWRVTPDGHHPTSLLVDARDGRRGITMKGYSGLLYQETSPLVSPHAVLTRYPVTTSAGETVATGRETIGRILHRKDPRLLVVVGPCSIHEPSAALDYARLLNDARMRFRRNLFVVMRAHFEKPRTTFGWPGLIHDPQMDKSFDVVGGITEARKLLLHINNMGLPTAVEMLDPISLHYIADLVSLAAIGARTVESQLHRAVASALSMPVGYKNNADGNIQIAVDAFLSATQRHCYCSIDQNGTVCAVKSQGNRDGFVILRGARSFPNYDTRSIAETTKRLLAANLPPAVMVDCSHGNSAYNHDRQEDVWNSVLQGTSISSRMLVGLMAESNLNAGRQALGDGTTSLEYGVSVTDACVDWETTERMLTYAYKAVGLSDR